MAFSVQRRGSYQGSDPDESVKKTHMSDIPTDPQGMLDYDRKRSIGSGVDWTDEDENKANALRGYLGTFNKMNKKMNKIVR